jgi:hypothetical protein
VTLADAREPHHIVARDENAGHVLNNRAHKRSRACSVKRGDYDHHAKMRTFRLQLSVRHRQEALQHRKCRHKEESGDAMPVQAPGMQRNRTQDVAWLEPDLEVSRELISDIQPVSKVKGKTRHGTFCNTRNNDRSTRIG